MRRISVLLVSAIASMVLLSACEPEKEDSDFDNEPPLSKQQTTVYLKFSAEQQALRDAVEAVADDSVEVEEGLAAEMAELLELCDSKYDKPAAGPDGIPFEGTHHLLLGGDYCPILFEEKIVYALGRRGGSIGGGYEVYVNFEVIDDEFSDLSDLVSMKLSGAFSYQLKKKIQTVSGFVKGTVHHQTMGPAKHDFEFSSVRDKSGAQGAKKNFSISARVINKFPSFRAVVKADYGRVEGKVRRRLSVNGKDLSMRGFSKNSGRSYRLPIEPFGN